MIRILHRAQIMGMTKTKPLQISAGAVLYNGSARSTEG